MIVQKLRDWVKAYSWSRTLKYFENVLFFLYSIALKIKDTRSKNLHFWRNYTYSFNFFSKTFSNF